MEIASISSIYSYLSGYTYISPNDPAHELLTISFFEVFISKQPRSLVNHQLSKRLERIKQYVIRSMDKKQGK
jgi:hypothetical protein